MSQIHKQKLSRINLQCHWHKKRANCPLKKDWLENNCGNALKACGQIVVCIKNEPHPAVSQIKISQMHLPNGILLLVWVFRVTRREKIISCRLPHSYEISVLIIIFYSHIYYFSTRPALRSRGKSSPPSPLRVRTNSWRWKIRYEQPSCEAILKFMAKQSRACLLR